MALALAAAWEQASVMSWRKKDICFVLCASSSTATLDSPFSCLLLRLLIIQIYLSAHSVPWHIKARVYVCCVCVLCVWVRVFVCVCCVCLALPSAGCCGCQCQLMLFNETTAKLFNEFRFIAHTYTYAHTHIHTMLATACNQKGATTSLLSVVY